MQQNFIEASKETMPKDELSPYQAVCYLLDGAAKHLAAARLAVKEGNVAERGQAVGSSLSILGVLQASLDKEQGGEIAVNLDALYDYMVKRLARVPFEPEAQSLDEVIEILDGIRQAWLAIGPEVDVRSAS